MKVLLTALLLSFSATALAIPTFTCAPAAAGMSKLVAADQATAEKLVILQWKTCSSPTMKRWIKAKKASLVVVNANAFSAAQVAAQDDKKLGRVQ